VNHLIMPRRTLLSLLLTSAVLALALTGGCGRGGGDKPSASGATATPTVRIAFFPNVTHAVALVGTGSGEFSKALGPNVRVEERTFTAGPAEIEALFADEIDIGYVGPGPALNGFLKSRGDALRIIAGASSGGAGLVVRRDAGITRIEDLAGKRVAVPQTGGTQDISLRHALAAASLAPTEKGGSVSVVQNAPADTLTQFTQNRIDAAWVPEPWVTRLIQEGGGTLLIDERDHWPEKKVATTVVIVRRAFLDEHPDLVRKFLAGHVSAVERLRSQPDVARAVVAQQIERISKKAIPDQVLRDALGRTDLTYDPIGESVLTFADWAKELGYQRQGREALNDLIVLAPLNDLLKERKLPEVR
jgi:NitT/TauT family transport system substrate-binding protein